MTAISFNWQMVKHLVAKDWYFNRGPLMLYTLFGLISVAMLAARNTSAFYVGAVLLISAVIIVGIHLIVTTIINERKHQTLPFIMSLPISYMDYTMAKMLINIGLFLGIWLLLAVGTYLVIFTIDTVPDGITPFVTIALLELAVAFLLIFGIAIVSESEVLTIVFLTITNIGVSLFWHFTAATEAIGAQMQGDKIDWNATVITFISVEVLLALIIVLITFYLQSKKHDFL